MNYINQAMSALRSNQQRVLQQWQANQRNSYPPSTYPGYTYSAGGGAGTITDSYNPASRISQAQALLDAYEQSAPTRLVAELYPGQTLHVTVVD
jgi:hypothetical protein